jgi:5'-methylthioadenosine phosphorylase
MGVMLGGIYIQTTGPRLETKAEINFFKRFGDIVGMTLASEATLCMEQGIPYVSICSVDNYCNGIGGKRLTVAQMTRNAKKSVQAFERLVNALIQENGP